MWILFFEAIKSDLLMWKIYSEHLLLLDNLQPEPHHAKTSLKDSFHHTIICPSVRLSHISSASYGRGTNISIPPPRDVSNIASKETISLFVDILVWLQSYAMKTKTPWWIGLGSGYSVTCWSEYDKGPDLEWYSLHLFTGDCCSFLFRKFQHRIYTLIMNKQTLSLSTHSMAISHKFISLETDIIPFHCCIPKSYFLPMHKVCFQFI